MLCIYREQTDGKLEKKSNKNAVKKRTYNLYNTLVHVSIMKDVNIMPYGQWHKVSF